MASDWGLSVTMLGVMCVVGVSLRCGWVVGGRLVVVVVLFFTRGNLFLGWGEMILLLTYTVQSVTTFWKALIEILSSKSMDF